MSNGAPTTAATAGPAMKAQRLYELGTLLGTVLEPMSDGTGIIRVLVTLR